MVFVEKNGVSVWGDGFPVKDENSHKYSSGLALIHGAPNLTGATRLAAQACSRVGAGLVNVTCDEKSYDIYRSTLPAQIIVRNDVEWWDKRVSACLYGPGGLSVLPKFDHDVPVVLDADALCGLPVLSGNYVLTPHEGEFALLFPDLRGSREERILAASKKIGAYIVLKGARTLIASPEGRLVENDHASAYLASAGTGDVLAGIITGLLAQGMGVFEACCAGVWLHGDCGLRAGPGLVATDLPELLPASMQDILLDIGMKKAVPKHIRTAS